MADKRLVDAYSVIKKIDHYYNISPFTHPGTTWLRGLELATGLLLNEPTVDAVEVVHGHWKKLTTGGYDFFGSPTIVTLACNCSVCGVDGREETNYCSNCGAKMDGERK